MKTKGIGIIGRVADGAELLDGQTVKTKILCEELKKTFPDRKVICVDTYQYKRRIFPIISLASIVVSIPSSLRTMPEP